MSELSSLYCKVKISKIQLEKFLNTNIEKPELNKNWTDYWDSREMYSKSALTQEQLYTYKNNTNQEVLDDWMNYREAMAFSDYDEVNEEWHWGMMFFSENYTEMIPMFAFILSLEKHVSESPENGAIVFPFFWGDDDVSAFIYFENGKGILSPKVQTLKDADLQFVELSKEFLNQKWDDLSKDMEMD